MIYLLTAIELTPGGSSTIYTCTHTIHRAIQLATLVGRLSGIRAPRLVEPNLRWTNRVKIMIIIMMMMMIIIIIIITNK